MTFRFLIRFFPVSGKGPFMCRTWGRGGGYYFRSIRYSSVDFYDNILVISLCCIAVTSDRETEFYTNVLRCVLDSDCHCHSLCFRPVIPVVTVHVSHGHLCLLTFRSVLRVIWGNQPSRCTERTCISFSRSFETFHSVLKVIGLYQHFQHFLTVSTTDYWVSAEYLRSNYECGVCA